MNKNLLIIGAGTYGHVAFEIATDMGCFEKIDFIDDGRKTTLNGIEVLGTTQDIDKLDVEYGNIIVAIGNPKARLSLLARIKEETSFRIVSLISPKAYVAPSARLLSGCIVEPMAVVHTGCVICSGCIISAGAVVNHTTMCCEGVHVDCNATVAGYSLVPAETKICSGEVYKETDSIKKDGSLFDPQKWAEHLTDISKHMSKEIQAAEYTSENEM